MDVGLGFRVPVPIAEVAVVSQRVLSVLSQKATICQSKINVVVADIEQTLLVIKELESSVRGKK